MTHSVELLVGKRTCCSLRAVFGAVPLMFSALTGCSWDLGSAYAIKATVVGLKGSGLELWMNGHDPVPVAADSQVTLAYMVGGYSYSVTVKTQPSNPTQTCTVANATGVMGSADVTDVTVTCRGWGTAQLIETDDRGEVWAPQVAMNSAGNAIAVWTQSDGTYQSIWANQYTTSNGWSTARLIETDDRGDAYGPQAAMDPAGNAIIVWRQSDGSNYHIMANRYEATKGWGTEQPLETGSVGATDGLAVAVDSAGNAVAVWQQFDSTLYNVWTNYYTADVGWGTAQSLGTDSAGGVGDLTVAMDSTGNAIAVWSQWNGAHYDISSSRYDAVSAKWGDAELIETDSGDAFEPQVATDSGGNAIAVWRQNGTSKGIFANRYSVGSGWGSAQLIGTEDANTSLDAQIAMNTAGNAVVAWIQEIDGVVGVAFNSFFTNSGWGTSQIVWVINGSLIDLVAMGAEPVHIAIDEIGNSIAVWTQIDGIGTAEVWATFFTAGIGWGIPQLIEVDNNKNAIDHQVAMDSAGNAIAVWRQSDEMRNNIWARNFR